MNIESVLRGILAAVAVSALAGCASISRSRDFNGVRVDSGEVPMESIEITNNGWFLFKCIPLASGDPDNPNGNSCKFFRNTVRLQSNLEMLDTEMERVNSRRFMNLSSYYSDETFLFVLLARRSYHTSAVLLK